MLQAKREYEAEAVHRIQIYFADSHGSWRWTDSRHKRPMGSIVLNPGVKEMLLEDTKDFLRSEKVCLNDPTSSPNTLGTCHTVTGSTSHDYAALPALFSRRLCISPDRLFLTFI